MTYIMGDIRFLTCGCQLIYDGEGGWWEKYNCGNIHYADTTSSEGKKIDE